MTNSDSHSKQNQIGEMPLQYRVKTSPIEELKLHGVAVYNPALWNDDEIVDYFIARKDLLEKIVDSLQREQPNIPPQHQMLMGLRGMGKTTFLRRLAVAVKRHPELSQNWLPLSFPEEQYNVVTLKDLWLNCLDALGDALEAEGRDDEAERVDDIIEKSRSMEEEAVLQELIILSHHYEKRLLLLIDNIDLIFERIKQEHWHLREILQSEPQLMFMGASSRAMEVTYEYDAAFYDFFLIHELKRLSLEETRNILQELAQLTQVPKVEDILKHDPARISTLHTLTGGNPRTIALLFKVLSQGLDGDVRSDLEGLLDMVTPLYKSRFEELPSLSQQMVDSMALHWDPITANKLAERLNTTVNKVSAQLSRLESAAVVEKVPPVEGKRSAFQISERFFNIWYLMRASRRVRKKLIWLVYFLKMFFSAQELQLHSRKRLGSRNIDLRGAEYNLALAQTLSGGIKSALEHQAMENLLTQHAKGFTGMFDFSGEDKALYPKAERIQKLNALKAELTTVLTHHDWLTQTEKQRFIENLLGCPRYDMEHKAATIERLKNADKAELRDCLTDREALRNMLFSKINTSWDLLYPSIASGLMLDQYDQEGAEAVAETHSNPDFLTLWQSQKGLFVQLKNFRLSDKETALTILKQHKQENLHNPIALAHNAYWTFMFSGKTDSAEYLTALQSIDPEREPLNDLIQLYLADAYAENKQPEEAEKLLQELSQKHPDNVVLWESLGGFYDKSYPHIVNAVNSYRKLLKIAPENHEALMFLAKIYQSSGFTLSNALHCAQKLTRLHPYDAEGWVILGNLAGFEFNDFATAETAFLNAQQYTSDSDVPNGSLIEMYLKSGQVEKAEQLLAEIEADEKFSAEVKLILNILNTAIHVFFHKDFNQAVSHCEKLLKADPDNPFGLLLFHLIHQYFLHDIKAGSKYLVLAKQSEAFISDYAAFLLFLTNLNQWDLIIELMDEILLRSFDELDETTLVQFTIVIRRFITNNQLAKLITAISNKKVTDQWRPLVVALECINANTPRTLLGVAPEIRSSAIQIVRQVSSDQTFNEAFNEMFPLEKTKDPI